MKLHKRHVQVEQARREFMGSMIDLQAKYSLTDAERVVIVSEWMAANAWNRVERDWKSKPLKE